MSNIRDIAGCGQVVTVEAKPYDFVNPDGEQVVGCNYFVWLQDEGSSPRAIKLRTVQGLQPPDYELLDALRGSWINYRERLGAYAQIVRGQAVAKLDASLLDWSEYDDGSTKSNGRRAAAEKVAG